MEFYTGHDGKEVTLKRFTVELDSSTSGSTTKSFAKDNVDYNESAINKMTSKEVTPVIASTSNQSRAVTKKLRKYDVSYVFRIHGNPQCVICSKFSQIAPAKMRRHLKSVNSELKEKDVEFFIEKSEKLKIKKFYGPNYENGK
ncbi:uncharacterized protein LOC142331625 [Lycorma delicatula]|uniref:uncharacterized protein LOC142331625 n=1 Tax=Lycorma delicatula TaxID=130591 RepID=UPI003F50FAD5